MKDIGKLILLTTRAIGIFQQIVNLADSGYDHSEIAKTLGLTEEQVRVVIEKNDEVMKKVKEKLLNKSEETEA